MTVALTKSSAWKALLQHRDRLKTQKLGDIILGDPHRLEDFEIALDGLRLNYALNAVTLQTISLLTKLAQQQQIEDWRARMVRGDKINTTENRAVLHTALRQKTDQPVMIDGHDIIPDVKAAKRRMAKFVEDVREGDFKGATGKPIRHIVNIGIGGSDLGPRMAVLALDSYVTKLQAYFVANADAFDVVDTLKSLDPAETLFVVVSKTFTTQETLMNAQTARRWLVDKLGEKAVMKHFVAVSSNQAAVEKFGIHADNIFPIWDWVGGRFSLWSAVGLTIALAVGMKNFDKMLDGAAAMDVHFLTAPLDKNMPVMLAMLGIWHRNFCNTQAQAVMPYSERLHQFPRYLQQLEMESNGKSVTRDGQPVDYATAPILFGECGTVGQHSFHQLLHQGTDPVPVDFIGVVEDDLKHPNHHRVLLANMVAQAGAFAFGQEQINSPHDIYAGNRSSNMVMIDRLDPYHLGMLVALYEHKTFVQGIVWQINSFDQPGVELGKQMAKELESQKPPRDPDAAFLGRFFTQIGSFTKKL